jgi:hypothetical protein
MSHYVFVLPLTVDPPTANNRLHWARRAHLTAKVRDESTIIARSYRHKARLDPAVHEDEARSVSLAFIRPGRRGAHALDYDQLAAKGKVILDALVRAGWLYDDGPRYLNPPIYTQEKGEELAVRVEVSVPEISDQVAS